MPSVFWHRIARRWPLCPGRGAAGQRERVAELVMMAREQGREVQIIAADRRSQMNLKQDERLSGELITGRRQLLEGIAFTPAVPLSLTGAKNSPERDVNPAGRCRTS